MVVWTVVTNYQQQAMLEGRKNCDNVCANLIDRSIYISALSRSRPTTVLEPSILPFAYHKLVHRCRPPTWEWENFTPSICTWYEVPTVGLRLPYTSSKKSMTYLWGKKIVLATFSN